MSPMYKMFGGESIFCLITFTPKLLERFFSIWIFSLASSCYYSTTFHTGCIVLELDTLLPEHYCTHSLAQNDVTNLTREHAYLEYLQIHHPSLFMSMTPTPEALSLLQLCSSHQLLVVSCWSMSSAVGMYEFNNWSFIMYAVPLIYFL